MSPDLIHSRAENSIVNLAKLAETFQFCLRFLVISLTYMKKQLLISNTELVFYEWAQCNFFLLTYVSVFNLLFKELLQILITTVVFDTITCNLFYHNL